MKHRIRNKIIIPYLLLALLVAVLGAFVAFFILAGSQQDRLEQRLRQSGLHTSQGLVDFEDQQLSKLRVIALAGPSPSDGLLGTAEALRRARRSQLDTILQNGLNYYQMSHLLVFDRQGLVLAEARSADLDNRLPSLEMTSLSSVAGVDYILSRQQDIIDGNIADKYSSILILQTSAGEQLPLLYTAVPIRERDPNTGEEKLLGGLLASEPLQRVVETLHQRNAAFYTIVYDSQGQVLASNNPAENDELAIPDDTLQLLKSQSDPTRAVRTIPVNKRSLIFAYSPLRIRERIDGYFAVALGSESGSNSWQPTRHMVIALTLLVLTAVVLLGQIIAQRITQPLQELARTASAIAQGQLDKRSRIRSSDEVGMLATVLNEMADQLVDLYNTSRALSAELEVDGILRVTNQAIQRLIPGTTVAAIVPHEGQWAVVAGQYDQPRPLTWFDGEGARRLAAFAEAPVLSAIIDAVELEDLAPRWGLPLRSQHDTIGLLLISGGAPELDEQSVRQPLMAIASMTATSLQNALLYAKVEQEASKHRAILESIADGVIVCDTHGNIVLANKAAATMLDQPITQLCNTHFAELALAPIEQAPELFVDEESNLEDLYEINQRTVTLSSSPVVRADGLQLGEVLILHDVTAQRQIDRAKTDFIATVSHELRTPLTPIRGYLDLLLQPDIGGELNDNQRLFVETIRQNVDAMSGLLNNVIILARIESGNMRSKSVPLDVPALIAEVVAGMREPIGEKGIELLVDVPDDLPDLHGDPEHMKIVLEELLKNADRYTSEGRISVMVAPNDAYVQINVADTGQGISSEDQQRLFSRFSRGGEQRGLVSEERGAGLGLAIVRQLIELQGGTISVASEVGQGSVFSIRLPTIGVNDARRAETQAIDTAIVQE